MLNFFKTKQGNLIFLTILSFSALIALISFAAFDFKKFFKPEKTLIIKFKDTDPVTKNIPVYYNGIEVGKVVKVNLSDDYKYTLLTVEITQKNFNPPANIYAELRIEGQELGAKGVTLRKYLVFIYPENPSAETLKDGDVIEGRPTYIENFQELFKESVKDEKIKSTFDDVFNTMSSANKTSENLSKISAQINDMLEKNRWKLERIIADAQITTENMRYISSVIKDFSAIPPEKKGLQSSLVNIPKITENVSNITSGMNNITENQNFQQGIIKTASGIGNLVGKVDKTLEDFETGTPQAQTVLSETGNLFRTAGIFIRNTDIRTGRLFENIHNSRIIDNSSYAMYKLGFTAEKAGNTLERINEMEFDGELKPLIKKTIYDADRAINRFDCIGESLSELLSKRFLILRLAFGEPGKNFSKCSD